MPAEGPGGVRGRPTPRGPDAWPLLASLRPSERTDLLALAHPRTFGTGDVACHEGAPADSLHLVAEGRFAVRVSLPSGDAAMVNLLGPGDYFGELALLRPDGRRTATITALDQARTLVVSARAFRALCDRHPGVHRALALLLADRVDSLSRSVLELLHLDLDERVRRRLHDLAVRHAHVAGTARGLPAVVPLTQAQLAELVGGTRPSVNQALRRLVADGTVVLRRGRVEVHDLDGLRRSTTST